MKNDMGFCSQCHQWKRRWATITVDDKPHYYCEACWGKRREEFVASLKTDEKARQILALVTDAIKKSQKKQERS